MELVQLKSLQSNRCQQAAQDFHVNGDHADSCWTDSNTCTLLVHLLEMMDTSAVIKWAQLQQFMAKLMPAVTTASMMARLQEAVQQLRAKHGSNNRCVAIALEHVEGVSVLEFRLLKLLAAGRFQQDEQIDSIHDDVPADDNAPINRKRGCHEVEAVPSAEQDDEVRFGRTQMWKLHIKGTKLQLQKELRKEEALQTELQQAQARMEQERTMHDALLHW